MTKGKSKTGSRSGSDSNNASRASASDRKHDQSKVREDKSIKLGTEQSGKMKASQGGEKDEGRK
jgi:hypothetical protein